MGTLADNYFMMMYGAGFAYEVPVGSKMGLGGAVGYTLLVGTEVVDDAGGYSYTTEGSYFVPIQAFTKYYFKEQQDGLYMALHAGIHMYEESVFNNDPYSPGFTTTGKTAFSWAPAVGLVGSRIDMSLRYQLISTPGEATSYIGLRFGILLFSNN